MFVLEHVLYMIKNQYYFQSYIYKHIIIVYIYLKYIFNIYKRDLDNIQCAHTLKFHFYFLNVYYTYLSLDA